MMSSCDNSVRNGFPFTATQWQELEHQALVYKYMVSGMPIPSDLLFTIRRSLDNNPTTSSLVPSTFLLNQPQHIFQLGFGRKVDPEPGRCRRTDGKKWRCSKEAYPDSKYCERHMHRGRNRSRKPVESSILSSSSSQANNAIHINNNLSSSASINKNYFSLMNAPASGSKNVSNYVINSSIGGGNINNGTANGSSGNKSAANYESHCSLYSHLTSTSRPTGLALSSSSPHSNNVNYFLDATDSHQSHHVSGKDGSRNNNTSRMFDSSWKLSPPLTMGSSSLKQQISSYNSSDFQYPYNNSTGDYNNNSTMSMNNVVVERDDDDDHQPKKIMHHFLDERPPNKDNDYSSRSYWPKSSEDNKIMSSNRTHLSISVPNPMHDFFTTHK